MYKFVRWWDRERRFAVFEDTKTHELFIVPRSRIIPHALCEAKHSDVGDPNRIAEICAEENGLFGIPLFRWYLRKKLRRALLKVADEDWEKAYFFPPTVDFSCVRDLILQGERTDEAIRRCS